MRFPGVAGALRPAAVLALAAVLAMAAVAWVVTAGQMSGMDMGVATPLGSATFFAAAWAPMMAAMMLPGSAAAVARRAQAGGLRAVPGFVGSYLALWALAGVAVYVLDRPHGAVAAGAVTIAAGVYEITPVKRHFRRRCREAARSGLAFGLFCAGSSLGLMAMLVALGVMNLGWMAVITVIVAIQKLQPNRAAMDVPLGAAIIGLGIWIVLAPASVPGLMPAM